MTEMTHLRALTSEEISELERRGNTSSSWAGVRVSDDFAPAQLSYSHFDGEVTIASGVRIYRSRVANYHIGAGTIVDTVTALECRARTSFGNGVEVAAMNENGGRAIMIYDTLTAQVAYVMAVYRHRPRMIAALESMIAAYAERRSASCGEVGRNCRIVGARFVREMRIGDDVTVDGASALENGTLCDGVKVGVDVKAYDFIAAEGAVIDNGAIVEHCFVGESCRLDNGFTAAESLFFANSHCENGEATSIFAGPYTVSHHKSSLLIAGMFSFFNAGSGSNQSNHLFKSGAVHQAVHLRGCKFASSAYIMSPALEGAFTMVMGHHSYHHDTSVFPYSYLIERDGRSRLMPGANLASYGVVRDVEKWPARDKRRKFRDVVNFEEYNPYVTGAMLRAVGTIRELRHRDPDAEEYRYDKTWIRTADLRRGLRLYNKAIAAALGAMIGAGHTDPEYDGSGEWFDLAGQYITRRETLRILDMIESGAVTSTDEVDAMFRAFAAHYADYAHSWAVDVLGAILGREPSAADLAEAVTVGRAEYDALRRITDADRERDSSIELSVSYGLDSADEEERIEDYRAVRGLKE